MIPEKFWLYKNPVRYDVRIEMSYPHRDYPIDHVGFVIASIQGQQHPPSREIAIILYDAFMVVLETIGRVQFCTVQWRSVRPEWPDISDDDVKFLNSLVENKGYKVVTDPGGGGVDFESAERENENTPQNPGNQGQENDGR